MSVASKTPSWPDICVKEILVLHPRATHGLRSEIIVSLRLIQRLARMPEQVEVDKARMAVMESACDDETTKRIWQS